MPSRILIILFAALCLTVGSAAQAVADSAAPAQEKSASAVVEALHDSLLAMMKEADELGFDGRSTHIKPVVAQSFDIRMIAAMAVGSNWEKFNDEQRQRLVGALGRLSVATYASRFNGYSGETFEVKGEEPAPQGTVFVNSELVTGDGEVIILKYLLHPSAAGWRIIDVYFLGIYSDWGMRRSESAAILTRVGVAGLSRALDKKSSDYAAGLLK